MFDYVYVCAILEIKTIVHQTVCCTNQFVADINEIVTTLYQTVTMIGHLFQGLDCVCVCVYIFLLITYRLMH